MPHSRVILALALGSILLGTALEPVMATGSSRPDGKLEELRKLRRDRRKKLAEAEALLKEANEESQKKSQPAKSEAEALGKTIGTLLPGIVQGLLKDLKDGSAEAVAQATARLAEVGTPAVADLEAMAKSGKGEEPARAKAALELIKLVEAGDNGLWNQWATGAKASSAYEPGQQSKEKKKNTDDWAAIQVCGKPDTEEEGAKRTAWCSKKADGGEEWLELRYQAPVRPARVRIYETFNPGAVVKIEAQDPESNWQVLWEGKDPTTEAPGILDIQVESPAYATRYLRVTLDTKEIKGRNEIDAVQLIGEPTGAAVVVKEISRADLLWEYFGPPPPKHNITKEEAIKVAVAELIKMQEETGRWTYTAYHQDGQEPGGFPFGFQVGGTSIVGAALLLTAPEDKEVMEAVHKGVAWMLTALDHKKMKARKKEMYDVRTWGHCFALEFFCQLRRMDKMGEHAAAIKEWIPKLVETCIEEESPGGGWNYASYKTPASFVTVPFAQALMWAKAQGEAVPDEILERTLEFMKATRHKEGYYFYGGTVEKPSWDGGFLPGSAGRAAVSEAAIGLMGGSTPERIQFAVDNFYRNWGEMEKRRAKEGTHTGTYGIAPYYFYYSHRYMAQLVELLPEEKRAAERQRLYNTIMATRDDDGTWNDRFQPLHKRSRNVDTAFMLLAFLADKAPVPPKWTK